MFLDYGMQDCADPDPNMEIWEWSKLGQISSSLNWSKFFDILARVPYIHTYITKMSYISKEGNNAGRSARDQKEMLENVDMDQRQLNDALKRCNLEP